MAGTPVQVARVEVILNPSAAPRERIMNVWHCASVGATTVATAVSAFQNDLNTFYQAIDASLSNELNGLVPQCRIFNLLEVKPRQPISDTTMSTLSTGASRSQRELAVCLSYRAQYVSGVSPKRRRGRIYLGPWTNGVVDTATGKLAASTKTTIVNAAQVLINSHQASSQYSWVVYSPTSDPTGTGETGAFEVIEAWVDDELDIQRRRGMPQPGAKTFVT